MWEPGLSRPREAGNCRLRSLLPMQRCFEADLARQTLSRLVSCTRASPTPALTRVRNRSLLAVRAPRPQRCSRCAGLQTERVDDTAAVARAAQWPGVCVVTDRRLEPEVWILLQK